MDFFRTLVLVCFRVMKEAWQVEDSNLIKRIRNKHVLNSYSKLLRNPKIFRFCFVLFLTNQICPHRWFCSIFLGILCRSYYFQQKTLRACWEWFSGSEQKEPIRNLLFSPATPLRYRSLASYIEGVAIIASVIALPSARENTGLQLVTSHILIYWR